MSDETDVNPEAELDIHFQPIIQLKPVDVKTLEEDEDELFKMRAKLFRFDSLAEPAEWKERGVGDIKMLKHKQSSQIRLVMRREKTLKICCNHYLTKAMQLKPHAASDRAFVWTTLADFADEEAKQELLAIRFRDSENAEKFKSKFEALQADLTESNDRENKDPALDSKKSVDNSETTEDVTNKLTSLTVNERKSSGDSQTTDSKSQESDKTKTVSSESKD